MRWPEPLAALTKFPRSSFVRDVAKLSLGTLAGRAIAVVALPLLTRLYTPEHFALLSVYLGVVGTIAVAACLRLEIAIPLAANDEDAANLLVLSLSLTLIVAALIALPILSAPDAVAAILGQPALAPFLWLIPPSIAMAGGYSALQYWATRARRFGSIARTRIGQSASGTAVMLSLGWMGIAPFGLMLGNMLNLGGGVIGLAAEAFRRDRSAVRAASAPGMLQTLRTYRRYPIYSTPESLANVAGVQLPVILIASLAGAEAGFLLLAMQVMFIPMRLLGTSISQVYMSRAPEELKAGRLPPFTLAIMRQLVQIGVGPLIFVGITAPALFPLVFGAEWTRSGVIVSWLVPWMALQFVGSPVSMVIFVRQQQRTMLVLTLFGLVVRVGGVGAAAVLAGDAALVPALVAGSVVYYAAVLSVVMRAAGFGPTELYALARLLRSWRIVVSAVAGIAASLGISSLG